MDESTWKHHGCQSPASTLVITPSVLHSMGFDNSYLTISVSHWKFPVLNTLCAWLTYHSPPLNSATNRWLCTDLFTLFLVCLLGNVLGSWYPEFAASPVWLLQMNKMHWRFPSCLSMAPYLSWLFSTEEHPVVWMKPSLCFHSTPEGHLGSAS